ncbi:hypothetical protein G6514_004452, partial [Epicoccum nigrum]
RCSSSCATSRMSPPLPPVLGRKTMRGLLKGMCRSARSSGALAVSSSVDVERVLYHDIPLVFHQF